MKNVEPILKKQDLKKHLTRNIAIDLRDRLAHIYQLLPGGSSHSCNWNKNSVDVFYQSIVFLQVLSFLVLH